jgi:hypothetical protein
MKYTRILWAVLLTLIVMSGCVQGGKKQNEGFSTQKVSDSILDEMEGPPKNGHTLERHVGKTDEELKERIRRENVTAASTYYDKKTATKAVQESLRTHDQEISQWLNKSKRDRLVLYTHHSFAVGKSVLRSDMRVHEDVHDTVTVLAKDPSSSLKYKIITSYPNLKRGK